MPHPSADEVIGSDLQPNLIGQMRRDPMVLAGIFVELTRNFYVNPVNLFPTVRPWSDTNDKGHTFIEASYVWDDENNNRRPAIIVDIGDLLYSTKGVQGLGGTAGRDLVEGVKFYSREVTGSVVWMHIGKNRGQALQYGCVTLDLMDAYADIIQRDFCFETFKVRGILKPKQRKDNPKEFECRVQADFKFQETFQIKLESPKLKTISAAKQATANC